MPRKKQPASKGQTSFIEPTPKTAPCVPAIRRAVDEWRVKDYETAGEYIVVVKVIDILGNDTTKTLKVKVT